MALKYKLDTLEGVEESVAALYEEKNGAFFLTVEGIPTDGDVAGLKEKVESLLAEKKSEAEKRKAAEEEARKAREEKARKEGDYEALAKSLQEKLEAAQGELSKRDKQAADSALDAAAEKLAYELGDKDSAKLLKRFIRDRLRYEEGGVKVTDNDGNLTVSSLEDLATEFKKDAMFSKLVVATNATGGGAEGGSGGAVNGKAFNELTGGELKALREKNPQEYDRLKAEFYNG